MKFMNSILLFVLTGWLSACCLMQKGDNVTAFTNADKMFFVDTLIQKYSMEDATGNLLTFSIMPIPSYTKHIETSECSTRSHEELNISYSGFYNGSPVGNHSVTTQSWGAFSLSIGNTDNFIRISTYNRHSSPAIYECSLNNRNANVKATKMEEMTIKNKLYRNVLSFEIEETTYFSGNDPVKIYYAERYGIVKIEQKNGAIVERVG
jgi:hypothetical protein